MKYSYNLNGMEQAVVVAPNGRVTETIGGRRSWGSVADWKDELPTGTVLTADPSIIRTDEEEEALFASRRLRMWGGIAGFLLFAYLHYQP